MNLASIAARSMRQRSLSSGLTMLSIALGVMLMVAVLVMFGIVERSFSQRSIGYELIVGPKGSDLQLVLSTIYRISPPIENLPYSYIEKLKADPRVVEAVPIALGDTTQEGAFPIVGTTSRYFANDYAPDSPFRVRGRFFRSAFDAVIGAQVARENQWSIGSEFALVHGGADTGHVHDEKFSVVGVLAATGTPNDRTVFVNLPGFYLMEGHDKPLDEAIKREREFYGLPALSPSELQAEVARLTELHGSHDHDHAGHDHSGHGHDEDIPDEQKEVTSILLKMKSPIAAPLFAAKINEGFQAQAVNPIQPMQRLMRLVVGNIRTALVVLTGLIIVVSGVGVFVSIYNSMSDRRREIAVFRALGAARSTVFSIILMESVLLCVCGGVLGWLLGHGLVFAAAPILAERSGLLIDPWAFETLELFIIPMLVVLASLVGWVPALSAYRTDVARSLTE